MIRASLYGRLGGDPVGRTTKNNRTMVTASLAVDVAGFGADENHTEWIGLCAFGKRAEDLARHRQGDLLGVMGQLTKRKYEGRDGTERESWSATVEAIVSARTVRPGGGRKKSKPGADAIVDPMALQ